MLELAIIVSIGAVSVFVYYASKFGAIKEKEKNAEKIIRNVSKAKAIYSKFTSDDLSGVRKRFTRK